MSRHVLSHLSKEDYADYVARVRNEQRDKVDRRRDLDLEPRLGEFGLAEASFEIYRLHGAKSEWGLDCNATSEDWVGEYSLKLELPDLTDETMRRAEEHFFRFVMEQQESEHFAHISLLRKQAWRHEYRP